MRKPNRRTISIASDKRARIPFAMIGVLVLITSTTAVTVLNTQDESKKETPNIGLALDRTEAATQAATRESVSEGLQAAARAPVTEPDTSTAVGAAIDPPSSASDPSDIDEQDAVFMRYIKLRIYLNARDRIARTDQRLQDGTTTNASLPSVGDSETEINEAIDRVEMGVGMYDDDVPDGQVQVTLSDVNITVRNSNGTQLAQRTTSVNTSVPTTVFQLHEKNQEYQKRLNTGFFEGFSENIGYGFGQQYAARQYPVSWAKVYFDRFYSGDAAFDPVHNNRHTEILANDAIYAEQKAAFGTTDPYEDRIMRERWACFGLSTLFKLKSVAGSGGNPNDDAPENYSQAFDDTYLVNVSDELNSSQRDTLNPPSANPVSWNEDTLCQGTRLLLGDTTGDFPDAPDMSGIVEGLFQGTSGDEDDHEEIEIEIDSFADAAYYEMQGNGVLAGLVSDVGGTNADTNVDSRDEAGNPDGYDAHNTSDFEEPDPGTDASDFPNQIGQIINGTYEADAWAQEDTINDDNPPVAPPKGGDWSESGDGDYSFNSKDVEVDSFSMGNSTTSNSNITRLQRVEVTVTNTLTHERTWTKRENNETKTSYTQETGTVTYTKRIDVFGQHSLGSDYTKRGVDNAFGNADGPGPGGVSNVRIRNQALNAVFGAGIGDVEGDIESEVNPGNVITFDDFESELRFSKSASVDGSLDDGEYRDLQEWIRSDIDETRTQLKQEIDSVNLTRRNLTTGDDNLEPLRENVTDMRDEVVTEPLTGSGGGYANPKERARAEAQAAYIDAVLDWIDEVESEQEDSSEDANSKISGSLDGVDSSLDDALTFAQDALSGDVGSGTGDIRGTPQDRDAEIRVSASPSYLYRSSFDRDKIPAARAEDEGPRDTDSDATHTGMSIKQDNIFLPHPGFPLIPWPGYWYGTLSSWNIKIEGEYARFQTQTTSNNPTTSAPTTYVRDDRPVELEIDGQTRTAGRVQPINFSSQTLVVVVAPSYQVVSYGNPGIGDATNNWHTCTGQYPEVGPNAADKSPSCDYILD